MVIFSPQALWSKRASRNCSSPLHSQWSRIVTAPGAIQTLGFIGISINVCQCSETPAERKTRPSRMISAPVHIHEWQHRGYGKVILYNGDVIFTVLFITTFLRFFADISSIVKLSNVTTSVGKPYPGRRFWQPDRAADTRHSAVSSPVYALTIRRLRLRLTLLGHEIR